MPYSFTVYTAEGGEDTFTIPCDYIFPADIYVKVDGEATAAFSVNEAGTAVVLDAEPTAGQQVEVGRATAAAQRVVDFQDGSILVERDLDMAAAQSFFISQEALDAVTALQTLVSALSFTAGSLPPLIPGSGAIFLTGTNAGAWQITPLADTKTLLGLGSAAAATLGTGSAQVPTNAMLGSAAVKTAGTGAGNVLLLADASKLPALDGSLVTAVPDKPLVRLTQQAASGVAVASGSTGAWADRVLTNKPSDLSGVCTLGGGQFHLLPGWYQIEAQAVGYRIGGHALRLLNVTTTTAVLGGLAAFANTSSSYGASGVATLSGLFQVTDVNHAFALQHWTNTANATDGFGKPVSSGDAEVYASVLLRKVS